ncbi:DUF4429 domain-containing protein [Arthrobacter sp. IK3]|uniref:DUF4429 domain-containing protein n=1 Tax=Arthrobacter sp. IK3 TaxID=3448169 RepID=UPI003EE1726A
MGNKPGREAKARSKHGIPEDTRIWTAENGWVTYKDGLITVKMSITPSAHIPVQDIVELKFREPTRMVRGSLKFLRASDTFGSTQEMIFAKDDRDAFAALRDELGKDRAAGVTGTVPEVPAGVPESGTNRESRNPSQPTADEKAELSDLHFRAKYNIPAEAVLARSPGAGYVSFDGHYVTIQHLGLGRFTIGKGVKRIPVTAISSIQVKPSGVAVAGFIQFSLPGGVEKQSSFGSQTRDAGRDENSMVIYGNDADYLALRDAVEKAQRALHQSQAAPPAPPAPMDDVYAQLEKLGKLRDAGILTESEFETKKADLLARM